MAAKKSADTKKTGDSKKGSPTLETKLKKRIADLEKAASEAPTQEIRDPIDLRLAELRALQKD